MSTRLLTALQDLTIHNLHRQAPEWLAAACSGDTLRLDLSAVRHIDAAGIDLLQTLQQQAGISRTTLSFEDPSPEVIAAARRHNLAALLQAGISAEKPIRAGV